MSVENKLRLENLLWAAGTVVFIAVTSVLVGLIARQVAKFFRLSDQEQRRVFWGFTFAGPWIVGFIIFVLGPAAASFYYSLTDYKIGNPRNWDGLENYRTLLLGEGAHGRRFKQALFNSFYYTLIGVPLQILASLTMAILLNQKLRGIRFFRTTFYLPVILAGSPAALLAWRYMLTGNGGFVNVSLKRFADTFFVFDNIYRFFIYVVEGTNGFYEGVAKGDPIGPFKYTLPAVIGVLVLWGLAGEWSEGKRITGWRVTQILGIILLGNILSTGIVRVPVNLSWTFFAGIVFLVLIILNAVQKQFGLVRFWQIVSLSAIVLSFGLTLHYGKSDFNDPYMTRYLIAMVVIALPIVATFWGAWDRRKVMYLGSVAAVLGLVVFIRTIPGHLDEGRLGIIAKYLTFQSAIEQPHDLEYLNDLQAEINNADYKFDFAEPLKADFWQNVGAATRYGAQYSLIEEDNENYLSDIFPFEILSSQWIYGLVIVFALGLALLNNQYPKAQKAITYGGLLFFVLFAIGSFRDGQAYFRAFENVAKALDETNYHFALFHQATRVFPNSDRVPLWMSNQLWTKSALIVITMWSSGAGMLIFLAALKGVPSVLYEAAEVDGANRIQKFFKITLPLISPAMFYNLVIGVIAALQTFDTIYILRTDSTEPGIISAAYFLFTRTFRQLQIGEGAAASWILATIIVTLTVMQFRYSRWVHYEV